MGGYATLYRGISCAVRTAVTAMKIINQKATTTQRHLTHTYTHTHTHTEAGLATELILPSTGGVSIYSPPSTSLSPFSLLHSHPVISSHSLPRSISLLLSPWLCVVLWLCVWGGGTVKFKFCSETSLIGLNPAKGCCFHYEIRRRKGTGGGRDY